MANRSNPHLNPFEIDQLKLLKRSLAGGLDPSFAGQELSNVLAGAQQRVADRQAQMAPLTDALIQQAQAGAPIGAASALTNAYTTMHPGVGGPAAQQKLGAFNAALYPQGGTSPLYSSPTTTPLTLDATDLQAIDAQLQTMVGAVDPGTGFPYGIHEATMAITSKFRTLGYSEDVINQVQQYIAQQWTSLGGK